MICTKNEFKDKFEISLNLASVLIDRVNAPIVNDERPYKYDVSWFHLNEILNFLKSKHKNRGYGKVIKKLEKELNLKSYCEVDKCKAVIELKNCLAEIKEIAENGKRFAERWMITGEQKTNVLIYANAILQKINEVEE